MGERLQRQGVRKEKGFRQEAATAKFQGRRALRNPWVNGGAGDPKFMLSRGAGGGVGWGKGGAALMDPRAGRSGPTHPGVPGGSAWPPEKATATVFSSRKSVGIRTGQNEVRRRRATAGPG